MNDLPVPDEYGVRAHGPFPGAYRLTVDGYRVPHITAQLVPGTEDTWDLTLDERFALTVPGEEMRRWLWFVANAMAVAAGYTCHGKNCRAENPFTTRVMGLAPGEDGELMHDPEAGY